MRINHSAHFCQHNELVVSVYRASKAAVNALTESLTAELDAAQWMAEAG